MALRQVLLPEEPHIESGPPPSRVIQAVYYVNNYVPPHVAAQGKGIEALELIVTDEDQHGICIRGARMQVHWIASVLVEGKRRGTRVMDAHLMTRPSE